MAIRGVVTGCAIAIALSPSTLGHERLVRHVQSQDGIPIAPVGRLAQDADGFLWIGSVVGLVRYDGVKMSPWARETLHSEIYILEAGPRGDVVAADVGTNVLHEIVPEGARPLPGPGGRPLDAVTDAEFGRDGTLWVVRSDGALLERDPRGEWKTWPVDELGGERVYLVEPGPDDEVLVATGHIWRVGSNRKPQKLARLDATAILAGPEETFHAVQFGGDVWEYRDGELNRVLTGLSRGIDIVRRRDVVWVGCAEHLVALRPGEPPEILSAKQGIRDGGHLLVDREASLWVGTFNGLLQFPEPETIVWTEASGLLSTHTRWMARAGEGLWVTSWSGITRITPRRPAEARADSFLATQHLCIDDEGALWTYGTDGGTDRRAVARRVEGSFREFSHQDTAEGGRFRCAAAREGGIWFTLKHRLYRVAIDGSPIPVARIPIEGDGIRSVIEDAAGNVWAANASSVCHASAARILADEDASWVCERISEAEVIHEVLQIDSGEIWLATQDAAILREQDGEWVPLLEAASLPSRLVTGLTLSPRGGVWGLVAGGIRRFEPRNGSWAAVESLSGWSGVPLRSAADIIEDEDGTVWLASWAGVVQVPSAAREGPRAPPPVVLIDVRMDGQQIRGEAHAELPFHRNRLELHFAALSFREPALVRYRIRVKPDGPWTDSERPVFRYVDLSPGSYSAEVIASLDGENWSEQPAVFPFTVLRPWYQQAWAIAIFALVAAAVLYAIYRARLAYLIGLESQRARIAMDLHDELGSGLGSIGLLAGLSSDEKFARDRRQVAGEIAGTASELGAALSDIVWSLRRESGNLEALATHLSERAGRLFPGDRPKLTIDYPERWPRLSVSLPVRRSVQLIALEALHNAAKHAAASNVSLGIAVSGRRVRLRVEDDGRGIPDDALDGASSGLGLHSMRVRAAEIGAEIRYDPLDPGTRVEIVFDPGAGGRRSRPGPPARRG